MDVTSAIIALNMIFYLGVTTLIVLVLIILGVVYTLVYDFYNKAVSKEIRMMRDSARVRDKLRQRIK